MALPFEYEGTRVELGYRLDLLVDGRVIVEVKSTERPAVVHHRQLLTYLRLSGLQVGLLINFGMDQLRQGISRVVNNYDGDKPTNSASQPPLPPPAPRLREGSSPPRKRFPC